MAISTDHDNAHQFIGTDEAAAMVGRCRWTIQAWLRQGRIRGRRVGGRWAIHRGDFLKYMRGQSECWPDS